MRNRVLCILSTAAMLTAGAAIAQTGGTAPSTYPASPAATANNLSNDASATTKSISGTVVSSDANSLVLRTAAGQQMTFTVDTATTAPSATLKAGDRVNVSYHTLTGGTMHAATITSAGAASADNTGTSSSTPSTYGSTGSTATTTGSSASTYGSTTGTKDTTANDSTAGMDTEQTMGSTGTRTTTGSNSGYASQSASLNNGNDTTGASARNTDATDDTALPRTASNLPLVALAGLLALGGAFALRAFRA